jgi:hypothetical protein
MDFVWRYPYNRTFVSQHQVEVYYSFMKVCVPYLLCMSAMRSERLPPSVRWYLKMYLGHASASNVTSFMIGNFLLPV